MPHSDGDSSGNSSRELCRILDANFNRATEGARVIEEYARFVLEDRFLATEWKTLRHQVAAARSRFDATDLISSRDTLGDVGTGIESVDEYQREGLAAVAEASQRRVEQALRCLEEYAKVVDANAARSVEQLRYRAYTLGRAMTTTISSQETLRAVELCVLLDGRDSLQEMSDLADELIASGVRFLQLRDKRLDDQTLLARARALRAATRPSGTLLVVNDRPDIARLADADGVHVGQEDLPVREVRAILGPGRLAGVSTHNMQQARQAVLDGADYIGCGPTFASPTKQFTAFPGPDYLRRVATEFSLPAFAIGGITPERLPDVQGTGFSRVAVSSAVTGSKQPGASAAALLLGLRSNKAAETQDREAER